VRRAEVVAQDGSIVPTHGRSADPDGVEEDGVVPDKDQVLRNRRAIEGDAAGADGDHAAADLREAGEESGRSDCPRIAQHAVALAPVRNTQEEPTRPTKRDVQVPGLTTVDLSD
jgi:hypothetical protein